MQCVLNSFSVRNKDHANCYESGLLVRKVELVSTDDSEQVSSHWVMRHILLCGRLRALGSRH